MEPAIYFCGDFHLGIFKDRQKAKIHEEKVVAWLASIENKASKLIFLGDLFNTWFEYKQVVPKGYIRFLGQLARMADKGIEICYIVGNHDMWVRDYFHLELGAKIYKNVYCFSSQGKSFFIRHGDGLPFQSKFYRFIKKTVYQNPLMKFLYRNLHPDIGLPLAKTLAGSHSENGGIEKNKKMIDNMSKYCNLLLKKNHFHYFIFGHLHVIYEKNLSPHSKMVLLGDWIYSKGSYGLFDGQQLKSIRL